MDGLSKYISLLSDIGAIVSEIKINVPMSPIAFSVLIDSLNDKITEIQSIGTRSELDGCLAQMPTAALQSRLDNISWRDFVSIESINIATLFPTVEAKIKGYIKDGKAQDNEVVRNTLIRVGVIAKGDIPKAIQYLATTTQRYGYSFNKGTVLYNLLVGYGARFSKERTKPQAQVVEDENDKPLCKYSTKNGKPIKGLEFLCDFLVNDGTLPSFVNMEETHKEFSSMVVHADFSQIYRRGYYRKVEFLIQVLSSQMEINWKGAVCSSIGRTINDVNKHQVKKDEIKGITEDFYKGVIGALSSKK